LLSDFRAKDVVPIDNPLCARVGRCIGAMSGTVSTFCSGITVLAKYCSSSDGGYGQTLLLSLSLSLLLPLLMLLLLLLLFLMMLPVLMVIWKYGNKINLKMT
jgi:hypothetical protein